MLFLFLHHVLAGAAAALAVTAGVIWFVLGGSARGSLLLATGLVSLHRLLRS